MSDSRFRDLIDNEVDRAIGAKASYHLRKVTFRNTWDGEGCDIQADFVIVWRFDKATGSFAERAWGTHAGCIRQKRDRPMTADIFWGHYDLDAGEAFDDFVTRSRTIRAYQ